MEIDGYSLCPCYSEKKIRFCCGKEVIGELNQLMAKSKAGQFQSALDDIDRIVKKYGPKECLLTTKAQLLLGHGDNEQAVQLIREFVSRNPQRAGGHQQLALALLYQDDVGGAVEALQDAVEAVQGDELPVSLASTFRLVGIGLINDAHVVGFRAHLNFANYLVDGQDEQISGELIRSYAFTDLPFGLRSKLEIPDVSDADQQEEWGKKLQTARRAVGRGQFRKALRYLMKVDEAWPEKPPVRYAIAVLNMCLGYTDEIAASWKRLGELPLPEIAAIEVANLVDYFTPEQDLKCVVNEVSVRQDISDFSAAAEKALEHPQMVARILPDGLSSKDGPPPRHVFVLLDRPRVDFDEWNVENAPVVAGVAFFYGRQTDRPARIEWRFARIPRNEAVVETLQQEFREWHQGEPEEQIEGSVSLRDATLGTENWIPPGGDGLKVQQVLSRLSEEKLKSEWAHVPHDILDGKTPKEAASIPALLPHLQSLLVGMEEDNRTGLTVGDEIGALREYLGVPKPQMFDLGEGLVSELSYLQMQYLNLESLTDEQLQLLYMLAIALRNRLAIRRVLHAVLDRPSMKEMSRSNTIASLALLTRDTEEAMGLFAQARHEAAKAGEPVGEILVDEFDFRMSRGLTEKLPELLSIITRSHLEEPGVGARITQVLRKYGIGLDPHEGQRPSVRHPHEPSPSLVLDAEEPAVPASSSKLWLPD